MDRIIQLWLIGSSLAFFVALVIAVWHDRKAASPVHHAISAILYPVAFACAVTALIPSLMMLTLLARGFFTYPVRPLTTPPDQLNWLDRVLVSFMEFVQNPFEPMGLKPAWAQSAPAGETPEVVPTEPTAQSSPEVAPNP